MPDSEPRSLRFEVKVETAALPGEVIDVAGKDSRPDAPRYGRT